MNKNIARKSTKQKHNKNRTKECFKKKKRQAIMLNQNVLSRVELLRVRAEQQKRKKNIEANSHFMGLCFFSMTHH